MTFFLMLCIVGLEVMPTLSQRVKVCHSWRPIKKNTTPIGYGFLPNLHNSERGEALMRGTYRETEKAAYSPYTGFM